MELGIGAGWKEEEWIAYGYDFPSTADRIASLEDALAVITRMLAPGRATFEGQHSRVAGAINLPKGIQKPRIPIIVGGNGPNRTWRLAARFADELNLDGMSPRGVAEAMPVIRQRCEEINRDPASLKISVHIWWPDAATSGQRRVDLLGGYASKGVSRVVALLQESATSDEALVSLAADASAAGVELNAAP
jgi:alkanesulfonate monooxygenase SsuD/methylene tetrahydromethanopterin reductase-like flavin-dependent oxidoreductase (luciferase family)